MARSTTEIQLDLDAWYAARRSAANGKSITISTSAGSRTVSQYDLDDINAIISQLESELEAASGATANMGRHNFAVANFNTDKSNER